MRRIVLLSAVSLALSCAAAGPLLAQTAPPTADGDALGAADAEIARLSQQAEAASGQYFETLGRLAEVQGRIDEIEARIPALAQEVDELRSRTRERAVAAYMRAGNDLGAVAGADDPLEAARRIQWLDRLNAHDDVLAAELKTTSARLGAQRADLHTAREAAAVALAAVKAQGEAIDALLVDAQERRRIALIPPTTLAPTGPATSPGDTTTTTAPGASPPGAAPPAAPPTYSPTPGTHPRHDEPFLVCTRTREAGGNYRAYNPAGPYMGAYQFLQSTWNSAANHAGRPGLIGVPPHTASPYDQDELAWSLYQWRGSGPWGGKCDPE